MGNYTFFRCSKILGEAGKQECSENSRSQIVLRTDIFRKLTLGAPVERLGRFNKHRARQSEAKRKQSPQSEANVCRRRRTNAISKKPPLLIAQDTQ